MKKRIGILLLSSLMLVSCAKPKEEVVVKEEPVEEEKVEVKEDKRVSFMGVGDDLIHGAIYVDAATGDGNYDFTPMYENIAPIAKNSDIAFINQETMLGGTQFGLSGYPVFNSPTQIAKNLETTGFNLANLATNHSLDVGFKGIEATRNAFDETSIVVDGIYRSEIENSNIVVFEKNGIKFSFLAYTYGTNGIEPEFDFEISYLDEARIRKDVAKAKEMSDAIIVSTHWGDENVLVPNEFQKNFAKLFTELEVDVVVGTHPHVIQPLEWQEKANGHKTLVIYSLGNFIGAMADVHNIIGGLVQFDFVKDGKSGEVHIENVKWDSVVTHFERAYPNTLDGSRNFKVYRLEEYPQELASQHALNGYEGQSVNVENMKAIVQSVIDAEFLGK